MKMVLVGASTGGPGHIEKILCALPPSFCGVLLVAQHINRVFLPTLAENMNGCCPFPVSMAHTGETPQGGAIYFLHVESNRIGYNGTFAPCSKEPPYTPSVDELFFSVAETVRHPEEVLAVLLTGIGDDGARGMLALKERGVRTIAESEESAIVYGMPRSAAELGAATEIRPITEIIREILRFTEKFG